MAQPLSTSPRRPLPLVRALPSYLLAATVVVVLTSTGGSLRDPDVWWHVRTGRLILDEGALPHSDPWSFTANADSWVPTAWLSDVVFALTWHVGGFDAVRVLRIGMAVALVLAVWRAARRLGSSSTTPLAATALTTIALTPFLRERPQVLSLLLLALLVPFLPRLLRGELPPQLWLAVPVCWVWANLHGMWILLPLVIALSGLLAWIDDRSRVSMAARCVGIAILCWTVVLLTPAGPRLAWWPFLVRRAAAPISEWQATAPVSTFGVPFLVVLGLIVLSWGRRREQVTLSTQLFVLCVALFGLLANRNLAPAILLLLPFLVAALDELLPSSLSTPQWLPLACVGLGAVGAAVNFAAAPTTSSKLPSAIAATLAAQPAPLKVLNDYNVGGFLTGLAAPTARVAIDGRTDMWSPGFVDSYLDATTGVSDWRPLVAKLDPDVAVLRWDSELARGLVATGWQERLREGRWVLLSPRPSTQRRTGP